MVLNCVLDRYVIHLDDLEDHGNAVLKVCIPANFIQLLLSCTLYLFMPFQPWYLTSYVYEPGNPQWWLLLGALQVCKYVHKYYFKLFYPPIR